MHQKQAIRYLERHGIEARFQRHGSRIKALFSIFIEPQQLDRKNDRFNCRALHHEPVRQANLLTLVATGSWVPLGSILVLKEPFEVQLRIDSAYTGQTQIEALFFMGAGRALWPNVDARGHDDYWRWG